MHSRSLNLTFHIGKSIINGTTLKYQQSITSSQRFSRYHTLNIPKFVFSFQKIESATKDESQIKFNKKRYNNNSKYKGSQIKQYNQKRQLNKLESVEDKIQNKLKNETQVYSRRDQQHIISQVLRLKNQQNSKQLSILTHKILLQKQRSDLIWSTIETSFLSLLKPTKDQGQIRSLGKILYCLSKSKQAKNNYETNMALLLPHCSNQSFTQIIVSISRMGGLSQQFGYIVEKMYFKRRDQFKARQIIQINYMLAKNNRLIDIDMINKLNSLNLREIVMMLRSYDLTQKLTSEILKKCTPAIIARKKQTNVLDLSDLIQIFTKYQFLDENIVLMLEEQYQLLARNINQEAFEKIWTHVPTALNSNKLSVKFTEMMIKTIKILKSKALFSQKIWKQIKDSFSSIENLEVRIKLQKL